MTSPVPGVYLSPIGVKVRERNRQRAHQSGDNEAFAPSELLSLSLTCMWLTVGLKITLEWCLLCHSVTLFRIMDNHQRSLRAAHWSNGIVCVLCGGGELLGATTKEMPYSQMLKIIFNV